MPYFDEIDGCTVENILKMISGKWKPSILYELFQRTMRFGQLQKALPTVSRQVLTTQLRELERDGLINRKVYTVMPPKVEYTISKLGKEIEPILTKVARLHDEMKWNEKK
ncbi:winged helix-turn-helix transcriptional regulator [Shimazuella kribbensis]|uniref:winged helix-turn-helix transcriptional regulator n=1 Tax=Shimazuella kribbensis TaxID=139808 RepID=UPI0003FEF5EF|nr:helix-turn-helix domain-containing protein [Shimazuella kribbensis]